MKYIDTHAHLNLSQFADDIDTVVARCATAGVAVCNVGIDHTTSQRAVALATKYDDLYAMVGLHPVDALETSFDTAAFRTLAAQTTKVIAIGECGFDYFHHNDAATYTTQEAAFIAQIELANELQLPLMIHTRGPKPGEVSPTGRSVYADVYDVLKQHAKVPFNVHFYAGTYAEAERFFELGGTISFTGVITFAKDYEEVVRRAPLEKIHAETDCPFVAPTPHRGKRAEPWMVTEVYKTIAAIKRIGEEQARVQLFANARSQYRLS